ncbi:MAG: histone H1 [Planctomycetota bacterium]
MDAYEQLKHLVNEAEDDMKKADGGNKAAGTRVRKKMQEIKNQAQEVRVKVLETRDDE